MPEVPYFKCYRSEVAKELLAASTSAFLLLLQIAWRARRTDSFNRHDLAIGEAFLGDFKNIGITEGKYRHAKKYLEDHRFATFRATNKGTIAKLINIDVFDPNLENSNEQHNTPATNQRRTNNEPTTTNKNDKNDKNDKNENNDKNEKGNSSVKDIPLRKEPHRNKNMSNDVKLITLDKAITATERETEEYKGRYCGLTACGDELWDSGSRERWLEMRKKLKALKEKREAILLE